MFFDKLINERSIPFKIERRAVYKLLGYREGKTALPEKIIHLVDESFKEAVSLIEPEGVYLIRRIKEKIDNIKFFNSLVVLKGKSMQMLLKESLAVIFMGVTIGHGVEKRMTEETRNGNFEKALVFDAIGSEATESAAKSLNYHLVIMARQSKHFLTTRFSPGYGDFDLQIQKDIFKELSLQELGIEITEKNILIPNKTITAIMGVE